MDQLYKFLRKQISQGAKPRCVYETGPCVYNIYTHQRNVYKFKKQAGCGLLQSDFSYPCASAIEILNMKLVPKENDLSDENSGLAMLFGVKDLLDKQGLRIHLLHSKLAP